MSRFSIVALSMLFACTSPDHARKRCEEVESEVNAAAVRCGFDPKRLDMATTFDCAHARSIRDEKALDAVCLPHIRGACVNGARLNPMPSACIDQVRR